MKKKKVVIMKMVNKRFKRMKNLKYKSKFVEWMKLRYLLNFRKSLVKHLNFLDMFKMYNIGALNQMKTFDD